jgi:hypothetical protein
MFEQVFFRKIPGIGVELHKLGLELVVVLGGQNGQKHFCKATLFTFIQE